MNDLEIQYVQLSQKIMTTLKLLLNLNLSTIINKWYFLKTTSILKYPVI